MKAAIRTAELLSRAGIALNGRNPWDPQVHNEKVYDRIFAGGSLALGESYMDSWWDVDDLSEFFFKLFRSGAASELVDIGIVFQVIKSKLFNLQNATRAFEVGEKHYDIGNDLYERMLDRRMMYSCGYWKGATTLDEAQENKLDLICRKIALKAGDNILDIGCGWGGFAKFAAERYGARVLGITVSREQAKFAHELTRGLDVEIRLQDWRVLKGESFNHIVSIGMFEHVGPKNYGAFMEKVRELLLKDGLFLLHTIGRNDTSKNLDPWFDKYIFPNGHLPSLAQITKAADKHSFGGRALVMEDVHNFGSNYDLTLMAWHKNFESAWPTLEKKYGERFRRMWNYYLLVSAGMFRARHLQLWQMVYSKQGVLGGYQSVR